MDIYARITGQSDGCVLTAFFQYTDSVFMNEYNVDKERLQSIKNYVREFEVLAYKNVVDEQIKKAKKDVSEQEGILKDFESDSKRQNKSVTRMEVDIKEYESDMKSLESDIKFLEGKISAQNQLLLSSAKGSTEYAAAKSSVRDLNKEKSKSFSKIKSLENKIRTKKSDIKDAEDKIFSDDKNAAKQKPVVEEKQKIVDLLVQKKEAIQ